MTTQKSRIPGLDGLRAVAILLVIICHVNVVYGVPFPSGRVNHIISVASGGGWIGVDLFFVLSGFLITGILYRDRESKNYYFNFYVRRVLRIFPLFYAYAIAVIIILPVVLHGVRAYKLSSWIQDSWLDRISVFAYFYNLRAAWIGHHLPFVNHFWSLAVEEHFYFVWPVMVLRFQRTLLMRVCIAGCLVSLLLRLALMNSQHGLFAAYVLTPCRLDGLLLGAWVALASQNNSTWRKVRNVAPYVATVAAVGIAAIAANRGHFYDFIPPGMPHDSRPIATVGIALASVLFAAMLVIVLNSRWWTGWLELPFMRRIGLYSYGMYVYHMGIIVLLYQAKFLNGISEARSKLVLSVVVTLTTFAIAALSYHGLEKPFLKLKFRYETRSPVKQTADGCSDLQSTSDLLQLKENITLPETSQTADLPTQDKVVR